MKRRATSAAAVLAIALGVGYPALAQNFPDRPIEMTVMFGAGSAADITARHLADGVSKRLGVPMPVVNRTGGGGAAGFIYIAEQKPNGYSIVWMANSISTTFHAGTLPLDYTNFTAVARVSVETPALAVKADAPWKTLKEFMDHAKANPGKVRIGNSGTGSHTHLAAAALMSSGGAKTVNVPFGAGKATANLLSGRIEAAVQLPAAFVSHVKNGDMRILAVLGGERDPIFPNAPTAKEAGYPVALDMWRGIAAPKGTPQPVIDKLAQAIKDTVHSAEFQKAGRTIGFRPSYLSPEDFAKVIAEDDEKLGAVMRELGMRKGQ